MKKYIGYLIAVFFVTGCQTPDQARVPKYKEVSKVQIDDAAFREINICRDGSVSDNAVLEIFLDGEFATKITQSIIGKSRLRILVPKEVSILQINAVNAQGNFKVFQLPLTAQAEKLYLLSESRTKSFIPIPLPGMLMTRMSGERKINGVSQSDFENLCGSVDVVTYTK